MNPVDVIWWSGAALCAVIVVVAGLIAVRLLMGLFEGWRGVRRDLNLTKLMERIDLVDSYRRDDKREFEARVSKLEARKS